MGFTRKDIERIVIETIIERQPTLAPREGRDLFWFRLQDIQFVWIYMIGKNALGTVWWGKDKWHYSIPIHSKQGTEKYQIDAWAAVENAIANDNDDSLDDFE
jgi:hypothetical protein